MFNTATTFTFSFKQREPISLLDDVGCAGDPQDVSWSYRPYDNYQQMELDF